jgi:hypothetical protein
MRQKCSKLGYFWTIYPSSTCAKAVCTRLSHRQHAVGCPLKPRGCDCPTQLRKNPVLKFETLKTIEHFVNVHLPGN